MNDNQPQELLPCPFCGRPAKLQEWPEFLGHKHFSVECTVDHSFQCPSGRRYLLKTADEAITAWNTRHTPTPPSPDDLAKAIERLENEVAISESDGDQFSRDITTVCNYAKQVETLREQKDSAKKAYQTVKDWAHRLEAKIIAIMDMCEDAAREEPAGSFPDNVIAMLNELDMRQLEQSSREQAALIEKLVEALNKNKVDEHVVNCPDCIQALHFNLSAYAAGKLKLNLCDEHRRLVVAAVNSRTEALSLAHSKGYGKK